MQEVCSWLCGDISNGPTPPLLVVADFVVVEVSRVLLQVVQVQGGSHHVIVALNGVARVGRGRICWQL